MSSSKGQRILGVVFILTLAFCIIEFFGGKWSGSLALIADATHMLSDVVALGLALFAGWMAERRASRRMTYGYYRVEILSALINGALLLSIAFFIAKEAYERFSSDVVINSELMLLIGAAGLVVNLIGGFLLLRYRKHNLNLRAAYFHVLSDALSSVAVVIGALCIRFSNFKAVDPILSFFIVMMVVVSSVRVLKDAVGVLLEAVPSHIDLDKLEKHMLAVADVRSVHDLHVWSIASGKEALSAHLEVGDHVHPNEILRRVNQVLEKDFGIDHTTLQLEIGQGPRNQESHFHD